MTNNKIKILPALLISITIILAQNSDSLVAHYKLSEEYYDNQVQGKFYDLSGNANHATSANIPKFVEDHLGNDRGAMEFDGSSDYLNCGNSDDFNIGTDNWTFMVWIKPHTYYDNSQILFAKGNDYDTYFGFMHQGPYFGCFFDHEGNNGNDQAHFNEQMIDKPLLWTINVRKDTIFYYMNGNIVEKEPKIDVNTPDNNGNLYIGSRYNGDFAWNGEIGEVWIYKRNMNRSELLEIVNNSVPHLTHEDFENKMELDKYWEVMNWGGSIFNTAGGAFKGDSCVKITLNGWETNEEYPDRSDCERIDFQERTTIRVGQDRWYSVYWKAGNDFSWMDEEKWNVVTGFKNRGGRENRGLLIFDYFNDTLSLAGSYYKNTTDINKRDTWSSRPDGYGVRITKGRWYRIIYHAEVIDTNFWAQAWVKDTETGVLYNVLPESGFIKKDVGWPFDDVDSIEIKNYKIYSTMSEGAIGAYWKINYYRGDYVNTTNSMYYDECKIGNTAESIDFNPGNSNNLNSVPEVNDIPAQTINESSTFSNIVLDDYVSDVDHTDDQINWTYNGNRELSISISDRIANITVPDNDWNGIETITFTAIDPEGASASDQVTFTVNPVNDAPYFTKGSDQGVQASEGTQTISAWATNISPGASNESGQTLTFHISNDNSALFTSQPQIEATTGDLTFTLAQGADGIASVEVYLTDDGGTGNGGDDESEHKTFTITVTGQPVLNLDTNKVNFGKVEKHNTKTDSLAIFNSGGENLDLYSCQVQANQVFNIIDYPEVISADEQKYISISFSPEEAVAYSDRVMIISNNSIRDTSYVELQGEGGSVELNIDILKIKVPRRGNINR